MTNEKALAEKLLQVNAVRLNPNQPFTWASGWKSPIYCDNRRLLGHPYVRDFVKSELCNHIFERFPEADLLAGVATAGIAWGAMAADQLKLPFVYVRPKPKEHGLGNQIEGAYVAGMKTVVIEDLISTGKSSLQVCEALRREGLDIIGLTALFTYGFREADQSFKEAGIHWTALTNYQTLVPLAIEKGLLEAENEKALLNWSAEPSRWSGL